MVNTSTNINKATDHLSPQTIEHKMTMTYNGHPGPSLGQALKYGRINLVNGILTLPFWLLDLQRQYRCLVLDDTCLKKNYIFTINKTVKIVTTIHESFSILVCLILPLSINFAKCMIFISQFNDIILE
jgi:superfamily I DNA and/or RNA helicase